MKREELIRKWLDNELDSQELNAFKALEDYETLVKLSEHVAYFKTDDYDSDAELSQVLNRIHAKKRTNWIKPFLRVAAILAICFSAYYYTTTLDTTIQTLASQKVNIELPDDSNVMLNAISSLTYNKNDWKNKRELTLEGEAYFQVAKGSKFSIETSEGIVSVLGTQFNVKQRQGYFEVICYEGSVSVTHKSKSEILKPGDSFLIIEGELISKNKETNSDPSWIHNESHFKSMPFKQVISEFERQYNIKIDAKTIDTNQRFTGNFAHNNIDIAIKAITLPLHLTYSKTNNTIILKRE